MASSKILKRNDYQYIALGNDFADREASVKAIADYIYSSSPIGFYNFNAYAKYSWDGFYFKFSDNSVTIFITRAEQNQAYQIGISADGATKTYFRIASTQVFNT